MGAQCNDIACKHRNLYQYGVMAKMYSKHLLGIENPRVGLMSIGQEDAKGNEVVKKARELIKSDSNMNFVGNIEGRDIFKGVCDVAVCDGLVGNVILKLCVRLLFERARRSTRCACNVLSTRNVLDACRSGLCFRLEMCSMRVEVDCAFDSDCAFSVNAATGGGIVRRRRLMLMR